MPLYSQNPVRAKMEQALVALAEGAFANSEINSVVLGVSQYWNDEADDAVHHRILYSTRHTPLFPHRCSWRANDTEDFCGYCKPESISVPRHGAVPWGDNSPDTIAAFEPYCREGCDQGMEDTESYLPYAIVRRSGGLERIGRAVRSWAMKSPAATAGRASERERELLAAIYASPGDDAPRAVLADWWLSREDPRGELVRLQLQAHGSEQAKERERGLVEEHGRSMFASISPAIHRDGAVLRRGLLAEAEVKFTSQTARELSGSPQWGTVERLHLLPGSEHALPPSMGALRELSGLTREGLLDAISSGRSWPVEDLAVDFSIAAAAQMLAGQSCFPRLVRLEGRQDNIGDLARAAALLPASVRQIGISSVEGDDALPELLATLPADRELGWVTRPDQGRLSPWSFAISREGERWKLRARLEGLLGDASLGRVSALYRLIPGEVDLEIVPSRHYDPRPGDIARATSLEDDDGY